MARKAKNDPAELVTHVVNETRAGLVEHATRTTRYDKAYQVWRGSAALAATQQSRKPWDSRMRIKYGMQVVDQAMVNVVQGTPKAVCTPRRRQDVDAAKAMEQILAYYADMDHLAESEPIVVQQALVYGVSPAKNMWLYREDDVVQRSAMNEWQGAPTRVVTDDRPTMIPWDVYDCWWEPLARDPDKATYVVLREWATKDDLLKRQKNPDTGVGMLENLDMLFQSGGSGQIVPTAQNQLLGYPQGQMYQNRFEIWEVWRDNRLTIIGNRQVKLYDGLKPYWMRGKPVVIGNTRPDFLRIEGVSETELVDDIQQALWTHENLVMENLKMTVMRGATVRETVPDMAQLVLRPNYMWPVTDHDDVHFQNPPPLPPEAYEQRSTLLGAMQYVTGISQYASGGLGLNAGTDQTATTASIGASAAGKLLEFKSRMIALKVYKRTYEQWKELTDQFRTESVEVRDVQSQTGWTVHDAQATYGDYDIGVEAGEESLDRQQKRAEAVAVANALAPYAPLFPDIVKAVVKQIGVAYGWKNIDELLAAAQAPPPPGPAAPNGNQLPQGPPALQNGNGQLIPQPAMSVIAGNAR